MTISPKNRLPDTAAPDSSAPAGARILPFERPQSDLQRAVQLRAQEAMDRERERDEAVRRPQPLKWLVVFAIAVIPVILIFTAVDGFLRAFQKANETYKSAPAPAPAEQVEPEPTVSQPGVMILQSYETAPAPAAEQSTAAPGQRSEPARR